MLTGLLDHCRMYSFSIIYAKQSLTLQPKKIIESSTSLSVLTSEKMGHRPQCRNTLTEHRNLLSSLAHLPDSKSCLSELLASDFPGLGNLDPALIWNKENINMCFYNVLIYLFYLNSFSVFLFHVSSQCICAWRYLLCFNACI